MPPQTLRSCMGDLRQFASVRRIVLEDGAEQGVRALAFSTGGGLDFWAMASRSMDIGPLWCNGVPLAWQAPHGFAHPGTGHPDGDAGRGVERMMSGLLMTCGLEHIRQPADGHPLHGRLPMTPARVIAAGEDWQHTPPIVYAQGEAVQSRLGGETLRLERRIEAVIGACELRLTDTVTNEGNRPQHHDLLYHFNFGYPGITSGSTVELDGTPLLGPIRLPDDNADSTVRCVSTIASSHARCVLRTPMKNGAILYVTLAFDTTTLPFLQVWQDLRPRCGLLAIEPCTSAWESGGFSAPGPLLAPGEQRRYSLTLHCDLQPAPPGHGNTPA